jgi:hypothetical protein
MATPNAVSGEGALLGAGGVNAGLPIVLHDGDNPLPRKIATTPGYKGEFNICK